MVLIVAMRAAHLAVAAVIAIAPGCSWINTCHHPDEQELSCQALPPTSSEAGCAGRPGEDIGKPMTHVDDRYPVGCEIRYPVCLGAFPESTKTCTCGPGFGSGEPPRWVCPV
jgi:hypothetical protein